MVDEFFGRRKNVPSSTTHSETEKEITEMFEKANFEMKKLEIDKKHIKRRIDKLCQGRGKLEEILKRTRAREEESKLEGREAQMQKSANLASSCKCEIGKHDDEINARVDMLENLDREQKKWDLELERLRDVEKMAQRLAAEVQKK